MKFLATGLNVNFNSKYRQRAFNVDVKFGYLSTSMKTLYFYFLLHSDFPGWSHRHAHC